VSHAGSPSRAGCGGRKRPWAGGFCWAGPLVKKKNEFWFSIIIWKENALEKYCVPFLASKIVKQIL
jgi:hypothetical protein